jgi:hypothetical protein
MKLATAPGHKESQSRAAKLRVASPRTANSHSDDAIAAQLARGVIEAISLLRAPQRVLPLMHKLASDTLRIPFERPHLYSYTKTKIPSADALTLLFHWIFNAQRSDGGIPAYYSLLTGYSESYPEVTGYIIPTLYDLARATNDDRTVVTAERATQWVLSLRMSDGAFPAGLQGSETRPSVFNTGQILQGLVRACCETNRSEILRSAQNAGDWLVEMQSADGSWSGPAAYQSSAHTYYSMVAWALAELAEVADHRIHGAAYAAAAERNLDWVLSHFQPTGWVDGINLQGYPNYLHFIAYAIQGVLECGISLRRNDAIEAVRKSAWVLARKFETNKFLAGAYEPDFKDGQRFTCLTGNAQISCIWLRLYEITGDLRYLNAALKMNEMLKELLPLRGGQGIAGGVSGSYPIWGGYQPLRYISWGCKFLADALLLEQRLTGAFEESTGEALACAS